MVIRCFIYVPHATWPRDNNCLQSRRSRAYAILSLSIFDTIQSFRGILAAECLVRLPPMCDNFILPTRDWVFFFICKSLLHESPISKTNPWSTISHKFIQIAHFFLELRLQLDQSSVYESRRVSLSFLHALLKKFSLFFFSLKNVGQRGLERYFSFVQSSSLSLLLVVAIDDRKKREKTWLSAASSENAKYPTFLTPRAQLAQVQQQQQPRQIVKNRTFLVVHNFFSLLRTVVECSREWAAKLWAELFFLLFVLSLASTQHTFFFSIPARLCVVFFSLKVFYLSTKKTSSRNS